MQIGEVSGLWIWTTGCKSLKSEHWIIMFLSRSSVLGLWTFQWANIKLRTSLIVQVCGYGTGFSLTSKGRNTTLPCLHSPHQPTILLQSTIFKNQVKQLCLGMRTKERLTAQHTETRTAKNWNFRIFSPGLWMLEFWTAVLFLGTGYAVSCKCRSLRLR